MKLSTVHESLHRMAVQYSYVGFVKCAQISQGIDTIKVTSSLPDQCCSAGYKEDTCICRYIYMCYVNFHQWLAK